MIALVIVKFVSTTYSLAGNRRVLVLLVLALLLGVDMVVAVAKHFVDRRAPKESFIYRVVGGPDFGG